MLKEKYSGKQVKKAGELLVSFGADSFHEGKKHSDQIDKDKFDEAMDILSYWRFQHEKPLDVALRVLQQEVLKKDKRAIFAKRLKRYDSIVKKLIRFNSMKLKNMQDIGGCRAIVSNQKKLEKITRDLRKLDCFKTNGEVRYKDYITTPKDDGYRSYHLIGRFLDEVGDEKNIEVQIRTRLQHDWATALEIVDLFTGQSLKLSNGEQSWKDFFYAVSAQFAVMEKIHLFDQMKFEEKLIAYRNALLEDETDKETFYLAQRLSKKLDVVKKFEAYAQSLKVVDSHLEKSEIDGYVLLEVNTVERTVTANIFKKDQSREAEIKYIASEKNASKGKKLVVALVSASAVGGIKDAYPNYFADSKEFLEHLLIIMKTDLKETWLNWFLSIGKERQVKI